MTDTSGRLTVDDDRGIEAGVGFILLVRRLVNGANGPRGGRRTYDGGSSGTAYPASDSWSGSNGSSDFGGGSSGGGGSSDSYGTLFTRRVAPG